ncbi:protein RRP6-like 3 isoform X1 [Spinacia oleracea]|uniref:Protein RRP6-like 3 isoform X1 n=2 Tax=Spinacia oleracea TaxID=3562 RepID=A0A9R0JJR7_SPIOL|nr:protein RRP6-like 3 isoform X1 [Spinacia oleracea]
MGQKHLKISIAIVIVCVSAISLYFTTVDRRRRRRNRLSCYLSFEFKPQSNFKRVLADNSYSQFKHFKVSDCSNAQSSNSHPYERDIMAMLKNPRVDYSLFDEISVAGMSNSHVWVESESQLRELVDILSEEKVFAVDTEQHGLRSFLGFTALVQISTQKEDYLIDTIALHDAFHMLQSVFSDPNVVKVFHGADSDVLWLQRDFHIYVVNLFDTAKACEVLSKPHKSLAYLLQNYCGVTTNKLLQREDWRQRPLTEEMVEYARSDSHYLLYIARCLIKELEAKDKDKDIGQPKDSTPLDVRFHFLPEASRRSNTISLQLFSKESDAFPTESVASSIISRYLNTQAVDVSKFSGPQFQNQIRKLCAWRDLMARIHDESLRYVLSDQAIVALAEKKPISEREIYTIISAADEDNDSLPSSFSAISPSPVICSHWDDVHCLLTEGQNNSVDDILRMLLHKHLGPNGSCSLSTFNYNLLSGSNLKLANGLMSMQNGVRSGKLVTRKASRELFVQKFSCKAPVYHNCKIYASDGRLLCYCDHKKLEWYLSRNLAKLMDDNPQAVMLLFEPKGRPEDEDNEFYIQSKRNLCVSCGESKHYLRYRIIPSCYRMHFPEHLKSHRSHDIVLLCVDCHEVAHAAAEKYKKQVATEFHIPLYVTKVVDSETPELQDQKVGVSPLQLHTAAMALLRHGPRMPSKRRDELMEIVRTYYGGREISHEDLETALQVGMSPQKRRKFDKKRGVSCKHFPLSTCSDEVLEDNSVNMVEPSNHYSAVTSGLGGSMDATDQASYVQLVNQPETYVKTPSLSSVKDISEDTFATNGESMTPATSGTSDVKDVILLNTENINPLQATVDGKKYNSKVSLLGHGPHGKTVVDYLLKQHGEEGIHEFCQRWRQVFIDALHPRYLPGGWDVKHSGRRGFGEFSVYNPAKKASDPIQG